VARHCRRLVVGGGGPERTSDEPRWLVVIVVGGGWQERTNNEPPWLVVVVVSGDCH
jgi:hypothetical protein